MPPRRRRLLAGLLVASSLLASPRAHAEHVHHHHHQDAPRDASGRRTFSVAHVPSWVTPVAADRDAPAPEEGVPDGVWLLLVDQQISVGPQGSSRYQHYARKVISSGGIEEAASLELEFDPSYEKLVIHHIHVERDGQIIDALRPREIKVIQQEKDLSRRLYNGTLSALAFLHDVRVGDVIDYAYTVTGDNPIFGGRLVAGTDLEFDTPVHDLRYRVLFPAARSLYYKVHTPWSAPSPPPLAAEPAVRHLGPVDEYTWRARDLAAISTDGDVPTWYDPYAWVQLSEFESWADVARWAESLYPAADPKGGLVGALVARLQAEHAGDEERLLAAIRFVQDDVRYLGFELGVGTHQPQAPEAVLARRYGDCKDKALLLVTLLRVLGSEAWPALVHTDARHAIRDWLPSPLAFDHVIVEFRAQNHDYWVDATHSLQRGTLATWQNPSFGRALVVRDGTTELTEVPLEKPGGADAEPGISVEEHYRIEDYRSPVHLEVVTRYRGAEADEMRENLGATPVADLGKEYLNFYAQDDPRIEAEGPPVLADDPVANTITTTERYLVPDFWKGRRRELRAWAVGKYLGKPRVTRRTMPLALPYPLSVRQITRVDLPERWRITDESQAVEDEAVRYRYAVRLEGGRALTLDRRLETLGDHVEVAHLGKYLAALEEIDKSIGFSLERAEPAVEGSGADAGAAPAPPRSAAASRGSPDEGPVSLPTGVALGAGSLFVIVGLLTRRRRRAPPRSSADSGLGVGLGAGVGLGVGAGLGGDVDGGVGVGVDGAAREAMEQEILGARCGCGGTLVAEVPLSRSAGGSAPLAGHRAGPDNERVSLGERRFVLVRRECATCGRRYRTYFQVGAPGSPS